MYIIAICFTELDVSMHAIFIAVDCGSLLHPENGQVDTSLGTTYQKVANYSCDVGYTFLGTVTRRCTESGQWGPDAPYCPSEYTYNML